MGRFQTLSLDEQEKARPIVNDQDGEGITEYLSFQVNEYLLFTRTSVRLEEKRQQIRVF